MECNVIKTYSFVLFGSIYYYRSLGNSQKFELGWFFMPIYTLICITVVRLDYSALNVWWLLDINFLLQGVFVLRSHLEIRCLDFYSQNVVQVFKTDDGAEAFGPINGLGFFIFVCIYAINW